MLIKATQDGIVRFDSKTPSYIEGLCTDGIQTCRAIILVSKDGRSCSFTHLSRPENIPQLQSEFEWIGNEVTIHIVTNETHYYPVWQEILERKLPETLSASGVTKYKIQSHMCRMGDHGSVSYKRDGVLVLNDLAIQSAMSAPFAGVRNEINFVNHFFMPLGTQPIDRQFIDNNWTVMVKIGDEPKAIFDKLSEHYHGRSESEQIHSTRLWFSSRIDSGEEHIFSELRRNRLEKPGMIPVFLNSFSKLFPQLYSFKKSNWGLCEKLVHDTQISRMLSLLTGVHFSVFSHEVGGKLHADAVASFNTAPPWALTARLDEFSLGYRDVTEHCLNGAHYWTVKVADINILGVSKKIESAFKRFEKERPDVFVGRHEMAGVFREAEILSVPVVESGTHAGAGSS